MSEPLDLFVIGGGSGGVASSRRAASYGARVAICEGSRFGGTCVVRGCVPKKLMHYAATVPHAVRTSRGFGWTISEPELAWEGMLDARDREIARLEGIYRTMLDKAGVERIDGWGRVVGRDGEFFVVAVGERQWRTRRILIAVGATPMLPEFPGIEHAVTSEALVEGRLPFPERAVVLGAGFIGLELSCILRGLGAAATIVYRADLPLRGFDEDLRSEIAGQIAADGVIIRPGSVVHGIVKDGDELRVDTSSGPLSADVVVAALGRKPRANTRSIGLAELGVRLNGDGVVYVDIGYETNVKGIYAVGDCCDHAGTVIDGGNFDLTPIAIAEGRALAERLFHANPQTVAYDSVPMAVFSDPEVATVGMSEQRARALGYDVRLFRTRFRPMRYTLGGGERRTLMKLVVDRDSDRVLGCHMVGDDAAEIIQGFAVALTAGATKAQFDETVALHPTAAEEFVTMYQPVES